MLLRKRIPIENDLEREELLARQGEKQDRAPDLPIRVRQSEEVRGALQYIDTNFFSCLLPPHLRDTIAALQKTQDLPKTVGVLGHTESHNIKMAIAMATNLSHHIIDQILPITAAKDTHPKTPYLVLKQAQFFGDRASRTTPFYLGYGDIIGGADLNAQLDSGVLEFLPSARDFINHYIPVQRAATRITDNLLSDISGNREAWETNSPENLEHIHLLGLVIADALNPTYYEQHINRTRTIEAAGINKGLGAHILSRAFGGVFSLSCPVYTPQDNADFFLSSQIYNVFHTDGIINGLPPKRKLREAMNAILASYTHKKGNRDMEGFSQICYLLDSLTRTNHLFMALLNEHIQVDSGPWTFEQYLTHYAACLMNSLPDGDEDLRHLYMEENEEDEEDEENEEDEEDEEDEENDTKSHLLPILGTKVHAWLLSQLDMENLSSLARSIGKVSIHRVPIQGGLTRTSNGAAVTNLHATLTRCSGDTIRIDPRGIGLGTAINNTNYSIGIMQYILLPLLCYGNLHIHQKQAQVTSYINQKIEAASRAVGNPPKDGDGDGFSYMPQMPELLTSQVPRVDINPRYQAFLTGSTHLNIFVATTTNKDLTEKHKLPPAIYYLSIHDRITIQIPIFLAIDQCGFLQLMTPTTKKTIDILLKLYGIRENDHYSKPGPLVSSFRQPTLKGYVESFERKLIIPIAYLPFTPQYNGTIDSAILFNPEKAATAGHMPTQQDLFYAFTLTSTDKNSVKLLSKILEQREADHYRKTERKTERKTKRERE